MFKYIRFLKFLTENTNRAIKLCEMNSVNFFLLNTKSTTIGILQKEKKNIFVMLN